MFVYFLNVHFYILTNSLVIKTEENLTLYGRLDIFIKNE